MKKNKLYTANKWNQPAFMPKDKNIFWPGGQTNPLAGLTTEQMADLKAFNMSATPGLSPDILGGTKVTAPGVVPNIDWSNGVQRAAALGTSAGLVNGFSDVAKAANPLEQIASGTGGLKNFFSAKNFGAGTLGGAAIGAGAGLLGGLAKNALSGGLSSDAGDAIGSLGSTIGSGLSMVNPLAGAAVTFASNLVRGAVNRAFGSKLNQENIANVENKASALNQQANTISGSQTNEDVLNNWGNTDLSFNFGQSYIGEDGWFSSEAADKYNELKKKMDFAKNAAVHGLSTGIQNADTNQDNDVLYNYSALGGPLNRNKKGNKMNRMTLMPAINTFGYGGCFNPFALGGDTEVPQDNTKVFRPMMLPIQRQQNFSDSDYFWDAGKEYPAGLWKHKDGTFHTTGSYGKDIILTQEEADSIIRANKAKNRREKLRKAMENHKQTNSSENLFAFGGDMQTNSSDFPTGLMHIDAGQSHEQNPNEGVQLGVDPEGVPNLVEENETVWNDYVFSARIPIDQTTKELFHIGKKREMTYADLSKKLEKEISERVNDPISRAGFEKQMEMLEEQQERQKQEMDAQRAKAAFEALSPEEQVAVMENAAQQEAMVEQAAMQQPSPEEIAMAQQQQAMADGSQAVLGQEPQMACYGGKLFADGGDTKKNIFRALGKATDNDFIKWLEENGLTQLSEGYNDIDWNNILTDDAFISALTKDDAALADAVKKGYSFGAKTPTKDGIVFTDPDRGNWDKQLFAGWNGSKDDAWIELVKAHGIDKLKGMKREDLEKAFKETNAYKNTTKWLQSNPENMRRYLKSVLDTSSSKSAKKHALQFVNEDGTWKDASKIPTYAQIFGENGKGVRETYPGTYWHSVREANIGNRARNLVWNPENEGWDEVVGDVGKDWALDSSYDFYNDKDNLNDRVNYYYRSEGEDGFKPVTAEEAKEAEAAERMKNFKPKYRKGLFGVDTLGPLAALTMQGLGIGRGDTSVFDAAASGAGNFTTASWMPRGDFMKLKLTDPWRYTMPILASSRATDRALMNSSSPSRMAGLLANGYNTQIALGEAALKGDDVNWQRYVTQKTHDAGVHEGNQREYGVTSRFNAGAYNDAARASANARMQAAAQRFSADRDWYGSLYGNVGNFFGSLTSHKKENDTHNMIADMAANGIFGVITPDSPMGQRYLQWVNSSAEGGKIKKKRRGLTF